MFQRLILFGLQLFVPVTVLSLSIRERRAAAPPCRQPCAARPHAGRPRDTPARTQRGPPSTLPRPARPALSHAHPRGEQLHRRVAGQQHGGHLQPHAPDHVQHVALPNRRPQLQRAPAVVRCAVQQRRLGPSQCAIGCRPRACTVAASGMLCNMCAPPPAGSTSCWWCCTWCTRCGCSTGTTGAPRRGRALAPACTERRGVTCDCRRARAPSNACKLNLCPPHPLQPPGGTCCCASTT